MSKYKVGQPLLFKDGDEFGDGDRLGVITSFDPKIRGKPDWVQYPYTVTFAEENSELTFTEDSVTLMVEDYNEFVRNKS